LTSEPLYTDDVFNNFMNSLEKLIDKYFDDIKNNRLYVITNFSSIIVSIAYHLRTLAHCNAGISYLSISADGKIYRCPRFTGIKNFCIGNVLETKNKELDQSSNNIINGLKNNKNCILQCQKCAFKYLCGGMCYHHSYVVNRTEHGIIPRECYYRKILYKKILYHICDLSENERRILIKFLMLH